jgi:hypothetical protein
LTDWKEDLKGPAAGRLRRIARPKGSMELDSVTELDRLERDLKRQAFARPKGLTVPTELDSA